MSDKRKHLHTGVEDGLTPLTTLDPDRIGDFDDLLTAMSHTAFGGRALGEALDVLEAMVIDPECLVVLTLSGAMTVAKMSKVIMKMIDEKWVDVVISTGALMAHGFIESIGLKHFKYEPHKMDDTVLFAHGYNRVYDTLEPEANFTQAELVVRAVMQQIKKKGLTYLSSEIICREIGEYLCEQVYGPGILKSAHEKGVPVYVPAFTDSELALDVACSLLAEQYDFLLDPTKKPEDLPFHFNPFLDLFSYARKIHGAKRLGILTIGGGVPRNWAQQVGPFFDIMGQRLERDDLPQRRFTYAIRICPEPVHWGGLSGCTYQEGISWGKFVPPQEGGRFAEVHADATIAWPILVQGLMDRLRKKGR